MVKRFIKRILVFSSVSCLVLACVPSLSFAIDPVSGAAALAGAMDAYGMAYGVGTVYDVSSSSGVSSSFEGLWDEFSSYQSNAGSQFDYDSFIDDYNQNRSLYGFEHSSGKFAAWHIDSETAEIFDQFWNWLLTGPAEMVRVDNQFQFDSAQIGSSAVPIQVVSFSSGPFAGQPLAFNPNVAQMSGSDKYSSGTAIYLKNDNFTKSICNISGVYCFYYTYGNYTTDLCFACKSSGAVAYVLPSSSVSNSYPLNGFDSVSGFYYANARLTGGTIVNSTHFDNTTEGLAALNSFLDNPSAYSDTIGVRAYGDDGLVTLPNPYGQDYVPVPLDIVTNVPWDTTYDDNDEVDGESVPFPPLLVPSVVDDIITSISAKDYSIEDDPQPPVPSEVFVPLLPVGLPSFNFSFSGIWHYVREWVSSLGAWFTTLFTIWGALPYSMVVPVYATAVVVIVLGVYKRFFM